MSITEHFPKMTIRKPLNKADLSDRETIEEYLSRGGTIDEVPTGYGTIREDGSKKTREYYLEKIRGQHIAIAKEKGKLKD